MSQLAILLGLSLTVAAGDGQVDYLRQVKPILRQRCYACHGALKQESELRLDTGDFIRRGGAEGKIIEPGKPAASRLIERVSATDPAERMPPEGAPLLPSEIAAIAAWIASGAATPDHEKPQHDPAAHWAFRRPVRPAMPVARPGWATNPIDAFIAARQMAEGVEPLKEADKATLLRRVTLDLIGVPPTRDELRAFLADPSDTAYERAVDRLLASPQYGERWGRHWMDVWRYSDWYGRRAVPDVMNSYPHVWRWRDWIVRSLNDDKGYDRMIVEMLAADEAAPGDDANVVATGFLVRNWFKWNYENWMKDNVEHTAKAFLGLTINCAHCHNHKYDPITQEEYFRFRAFFEPLELRQDRVAGLPDPGPFKKYVYAESYGPIAAGLVRVFDEKLDAQTFMYVKGDSRNRMEGKSPVEPGVPAVLRDIDFKVVPLDLPPEAFYPGLAALIRQEETAKAAAEVASAKELLDKSQERVAAAEKTVADVNARSQQPPTAQNRPAPEALAQAQQEQLDARLSYRVDEQHVASAAARQRALAARIAADDARYRGLGDAQAQARAAWKAEKQVAWEDALLRLTRAERGLIAAERKAAGDANAKPEADKAKQELAEARAASDAARTALAVTGDTYTPLSPIYPARSTGRRLALARSIANSNNPLTARVAVNHIWLRHFGRGLAETPANFGHSGKAPSHPELLDWLAVKLMEQGWRMKPLHRLIVTSRTYRLRSHLGKADHANLAIDRDNRLYWRANTRRMEAECVRDSILACAGQLNTLMGGQEIDAEQGLVSRRRSLYFAIHGEAKMPLLELFDAADVCDCYERVSSVRPQQALALANSDLPLLCSRTLAGALWQESSALSDAAQREAAFVRGAFEQILSRSPNEAELQASLDYLAQQKQELTSAKPAEAPIANVPPPSSDPAQRARETLIHALFNHNDFVTIR
ncbi:MAG TPA: PSD1 and planctomycete cytochrome C domain-containing protein [Pirellulales bacterium]|nr:PSD1 and planctomycete cytochrome C domain-containing protein [Pirellulales bacterium]